MKLIYNYELAGGYKAGDTVDFMLYDFVPYNKVDQAPDAAGRWMGFTVDNMDSGKIRLAGRANKAYDPGVLYSGKVSYVTFYETDKKQPAIVVEASSVKESAGMVYEDKELQELDTYDCCGFQLSAEEYDYECNNLGGCADCTAPLNHKGAEHHHWMDISTVLCAPCMNARLDHSTRSVIHYGANQDD